MLNFKKVFLKNFGSYGEAEIDLRSRGFCLVTGKNNYKKDNALSNGSGKSLIWSAICFALTGETIQGIKTNLKNINNDEEECYVSLDFSDGDTEYSITRYISPKSDMKIIRNSDDISGKGIRESSQKLAEVLPDVTKDLIASTIILGQGMPNKFSSFSPSGRKELLEKLTKSDFMIEEVKTKVQERFDKLSADLRKLEDSSLVKKSQADSTKKLIESQTRQIETSVRPDFDTEISKRQFNIDECNKKIAEVSSKQASLETVQDNINAELVKITDEKSKTCSEELDAYNAARQAQSDARSKFVSELNSLNIEINRIKSIKDVCPTCGQKIPGIVKPDTTEQENRKTAVSSEIQKIDSVLKDMETQHRSYVTSINNSFDGEINEKRANLLNVRAEIQEIKNQLNSENRALYDEKEALIKLNSAKDVWDINYANLVANTENAKKQLVTLEQEIVDVTKEISGVNEHIAAVKKMDTLIKRDFRGYLLENVISYLDAKAKSFCESVFGTTDLNIFLDGNSLNVTYCNKMLETLSGGERMRADLIIQLAIRDLMQTYFDYTSNIIVLDEVTDFLDAQSCQCVMSFLEKELSSVESVFIVSHHAEELGLPIDSEIKIVKNEDGISEVI